MNGTQLARGILRVAIGATMIAHGVRHGRTLDGTAQWFGSIGFRQPRLQARASSVVEIGSGAALLAGAATPLSAAAVIGTMAVAARSVHAKNGFFVVDEGWEFVFNLAASSVALAALGPGRLSVDSALRDVETLGGQRRAALALGVGIGAAAVQLAAFWRRPAHLAA